MLEACRVIILLFPQRPSYILGLRETCLFIQRSFGSFDKCEKMWRPILDYADSKL